MSEKVLVQCSEPVIYCSTSQQVENKMLILFTEVCTIIKTWCKAKQNISVKQMTVYLNHMNTSNYHTKYRISNIVTLVIGHMQIYPVKIVAESGVYPRFVVISTTFSSAH